MPGEENDLLQAEEWMHHSRDIICSVIVSLFCMKGRVDWVTFFWDSTFTTWTRGQRTAQEFLHSHNVTHFPLKDLLFLLWNVVGGTRRYLLPLVEKKKRSYYEFFCFTLTWHLHPRRQCDRFRFLEREKMVLFFFRLFFPFFILKSMPISQNYFIIYRYQRRYKTF